MAQNLVPCPPGSWVGWLGRTFSGVLLGDWPFPIVLGSSYPGRQPVKIMLDCPAPEPALPEHQDPPAGIQQRFPGAVVTFNIGSEFIAPALGVGGGCGSERTAPVSVPETAMNKDCKIMFFHDQVRPTGQPNHMQSKTKAMRVKKAPQSHFGIGVFRPDGGHHPGASGTVNNIHRDMVQRHTPCTQRSVAGALR